MKCYVIIVSLKYPAYHSKYPDFTYFQDAIFCELKQHTIRSNFEYWDKIIKKVNSGEGYLSLRYWSGKPRKSKQVEFKRIYSACIEKIEIELIKNHLCFKIDDFIPPISINELAINDGLELSDFKEWFFKNKSDGIFTGAIIHFNNKKYVHRLQRNRTYKV